MPNSALPGVKLGIFTKKNQLAVNKTYIINLFSKPLLTLINPANFGTIFSQ